MRAWVWRVIPAGLVWRAMFVVNGLLWASAVGVTAASCLGFAGAAANDVLWWEYGDLWVCETCLGITVIDSEVPASRDGLLTVERLDGRGEDRFGNRIGEHTVVWYEGYSAVRQDRSLMAGAVLLFSWETHREALDLAGKRSWRLANGTYTTVGFPLPFLVVLFGGWPTWRIWRASVWRVKD